MEIAEMTVVQLREAAKENGIKNIKKLKKEELVSLLTELNRPGKPSITVETAPFPVATKSYQPIKHTELIEFVKEGLDKRGLLIEDERFELNKKGNQLFATLGIASQNSDLRMALGFRNSYDKSMPVGFVSGAQVIVCSNMMFHGDVVQMRKHTSGLMRDLNGVYEPVLDRLTDQFAKIEKEVTSMQQSELSLEKAQQMFGELMFRADSYKHAVGTSNQINDAIRYFKNPLHDFGNETYWGFYNAFTEALKTSHPYNAATQYLNLHNYISKNIVLN